MKIKDKDTFKGSILILFIAAFFLWCAMNYTVALTLIFNFLSLFTPLIVGISMAFVFNVVLRLLEDKVCIHITKRIDSSKRMGRFWLRCIRPFCLILTLIIILGISILLIALIIPELKNSVQMLARDFPEYLEYTEVWLNDTLASLGFADANVYLPLIDWERVLKGIGEFLSVSSSDMVSNFASFTTGVFSAVTNMIIGFIFSLYILLQKEKLIRQLKGVIYAAFSEKRANAIFGVGRLSNEMFHKFITGQFVEAIIIGSLCFIGMNLLSLTTIFEFPYSFMISVLIGFTALIPLVGAFIGTAVGALLILMDDPIQALWFILFIIVLQQLESNLIYPKVIGKSIGLPGIWVMFAVIAGGSIYGIVGIIISVPLSSVLYILMKNWVAAVLDRKKIDIDEVKARDIRDLNEFKKV